MRPLRMSSDRLQDRTSCECPSSRSTALRCPRSGKSRQMHSGMQMGQLKLRRASSAANWIVVQRGPVQQRPWFALSVKVRPSNPPAWPDCWKMNRGCLDPHKSICPPSRPLVGVLLRSRGPRWPSMGVHLLAVLESSEVWSGLTKLDVPSSIADK